MTGPGVGAGAANEPYVRGAMATETEAEVRLAAVATAEAAAAPAADRRPSGVYGGRSAQLGARHPATVVAVGGSPVGRGVAPQLWTARPRGPSQNIPIRASKGMNCPDLGEIGFRRGRGFSQVVFPAPLLLV